MQYLWGQGIHVPIPPRKRVSTPPAASSYKDCLTLPKNTPVLWGSPYLMTNQGKYKDPTILAQQGTTLWSLGHSRAACGEGGLVPGFELIIIQSPLPNPTLPTSLHMGGSLINTLSPNSILATVSEEQTCNSVQN